MKEMKELVEVIRTLRGPNGCPWDKEQTIQSLKPHLIEEAYETLEAMDGGPEELKGELGDLLLQIILQSLIMEEKEKFSLEEVAKGIKEKMISRHPHVFGEVSLETSEEVLNIWDDLKKKEKIHKDRESIFDGIPKTFPPLLRTVKLQSKSRKLNIKKESSNEILENIKREIELLSKVIENKEEVTKNNDLEEIENRIGKTIQELSLLSKSLNLDVNQILVKENKKLEENLRKIEKK